MYSATPWPFLASSAAGYQHRSSEPSARAKSAFLLVSVGHPAAAACPTARASSGPPARGFSVGDPECVETRPTETDATPELPFQPPGAPVRMTMPLNALGLWALLFTKAVARPGLIMIILTIRTIAMMSMNGPLHIKLRRLMLPQLLDELNIHLWM